jgi:hypothetical protein
MTINVILWRIDPLLSDNFVTKTVSGQRLGKHGPAAMNAHPTVDLLLETRCFYMVLVEIL